MSMSDVPDRLSTPRLTLRRWRPEDADALRAALDESDAHLRPWIPFMKDEPRTLAQTKSWIEDLVAHHDAQTALRYGAWRGDELIGEVLLIDRVGPGRLELGYWIRASAVGQGFATESAQAMVTLAFDRLRISEVRLVVDAGNGPSLKVAERLGARHAFDDPPLEVWVIPSGAE